MKHLSFLRFLCLILFLTFQNVALAQIGIGTTSPDASAALDITSTDKGLLIPRMTAYPSAPVTGLTVYRTDLSGFYTWNGSAWSQNVFGVNFYTTDGALSGNRTLTMAANNLTFSSTTGNLIFNPSSTGKMGIGTTTPITKMQVNAGLSNATDGFSVRASGTSDWDAIGLAHDGSSAYINAAGADNGLAIRVNNGTTGNITNQTYTDVMRFLPNGNVGIGTTTPASGLDLKSSLGLPSTTTSASTYSVTATDAMVYLTSTSNQTITLPTASTVSGRIYYFINNTSTSKTISSYSALNGSTSSSIASNTSIALQSDGSVWRQFQNTPDNNSSIISTSFKKTTSDISHVKWISPWNHIDISELDIVVPSGKWLIADYVLIGQTSNANWPPSNLMVRGYTSSSDYITGELFFRHSSDMDLGEEVIAFSNAYPDNDPNNGRGVDTEFPAANVPVAMMLRIRYKNNTASSQTFGYSFGSDIQYALDPVTISILAGSTVTYSIY